MNDPKCPVCSASSNIVYSSDGTLYCDNCQNIEFMKRSKNIDLDELTAQAQEMGLYDFPFGPIPHWIKCSDHYPIGYPEDFECVLGWSINTGCMIAFYDPEENDWTQQATLERWKLTHWQALPEAPNE